MNLEKLEKIDELRKKKIITQQEFDDMKKAILEEASKPEKCPRRKNFFGAYLMCWRKYASFKGRASRYDFWAFMLVNGIITFVLSIFAANIEFMNGIYLSYSFAVLLPTFAVSVRRLHDIGRKGWWAILPYALIGVFFLLWFTAEVAIEVAKLGDNEIANNIKWGALVICGLLFLASFVYLFVLFFKSGQAYANQYGDAIIEERGYHVKGLIMAIIVVAALPIAGFLGTAIVAGYQEAKQKHEANYEASDLIDDLGYMISNIEEAYYENGNYNKLTTQSAMDDELIPEGMIVEGLVKTDFGGDVQIVGKGKSYNITLNKINTETCHKFIEAYWGDPEVGGFDGLSVNYGESYKDNEEIPYKVCADCDKTPCTINLKYKYVEE